MPKQKARGRMTIGRAFLWIFLSVIFINGSTLITLLIYQNIRKTWINDENFKVVAIVQTGPIKEALPTILLAELLDLSVDKPTNLYRFDTKVAEQKLLNFPVIQSAIVKRIKPGAIYIDYTLRSPVAYLVDLTNTAIDSNGYIFPFSPFFTPKNLPEIYLGLDYEESGLENVQWGSNLSGKRLELVWNVMKLIEVKLASDYTRIKRIDVSRVWATSHGMREIIVVLEDQNTDAGVLRINEIMLRLNDLEYGTMLSNYKLFYRQWRQEQVRNDKESNKVVRAKPLIVDLRIQDLAYVKEVEQAK